MSKRYIILLVLINVLRRLGTDYHIIGSALPQDRDTAIVVDCKPVPVYLFVRNNGITYDHCSLNSDEVNYRVDLLVSSVMAAIEVVVSNGHIND